MSILLRVALATILIYCVTCDTAKCVSSKTCAQCIGESKDCAWCAAAYHEGPRCAENSKTGAGWCSENVNDPQVKKPVTFIRDEPVRAGPKRAVQLAPQELKISVRPGQTAEFTLKYKPAKDYPLDIYYLMDFSFTMKPIIELLKKQGKDIYTELNKETNNVRLGVGSFIEKGALPFASPFELAYAFKHHLNLTTDNTTFVDVLEKVRTGANYDDPEAGLDALMQAMVCKEEIGWRDGARKIIVLCTDSTYHSAGDGKIAGAAKMNDMKCHLKNGMYSLELEQDYPSVNQIRKIAKQENTIIIFNVDKKVERDYRALAKTIQLGAEYVELKAQSDIVKTITDVYKKAVRNLRMDVNVPKNAEHSIRVKLDPDCTGSDIKACTIRHHEEIRINVAITAESCLGKDTFITIQPVGLSEKLLIKMETLCSCECEKYPKINAEECSSSGSLVCGICHCNKNRLGEICECVGSSSKDNLDKCKLNKDDTVGCSDKGSCRCGKCYCNPEYSGPYCQYHDKACSHWAGLLCAQHGRCHEGRCKCHAGWTGDDCHCPDDDTACRAPYSERICSGNGNCICGACQCTKIDSTNNTYFGTFCDKCSDCDEIRCKELEKYVECVYYKEKTKDKCDEEFHSKDTIVKFVNKTEINAPEYYLAKLCKIVRDDGKSIIFKHYYDDKMYFIIQEELEEPDRANMWIAIGSSIGVILLIGLLTVVIWKILVDKYDAREYEKFNKMLDECGDVGDINNVIYKAPTVTFANPLFNRKSRIY